MTAGSDEAMFLYFHQVTPQTIGKMVKNWIFQVCIVYF
jgi:hypothetical protein